MLRNLVQSIGARLIGGYLLLAALALGMGLVGYIQINAVNDILAQEATERAEARYLSTKIRIQSLQISSLVRSYVTASSAPPRARLRTQFTDESYILGEFVNQIGKYVHGSAEEQAMLSVIEPLVREYLDLAQAAMDAYDTEGQQAGESGQAVGNQAQVTLARFETTRARLLERLVAFEDQETSLLYAARRTARETVDRARTTTIVLGVIALVGGVLLGWGISWTIVRPVGRLVEAAQRITAGDLEHPADVRDRSEIGTLAHVFNAMAAQLRELIGSLEERVAERTAALERRSLQLEATTQVAREAAAIRDIAQLLNDTARLISERFGFYHAGIFLLDEAEKEAVLSAASWAGGQHMLARGHKLKVGQVGIVGYVAGTGQPRIALDVGADAVFFDNPDLPHTRSEMALPLKVRDQVIGVLDVQSTQEAAFSAEDMTILQTLADQVTLAIENARLFADSQETLGTLRRAYSELSREAWVNLLRARRGIGYQADRSGVSKLEATTPETWEAEAQCAWQMGQTIQERSDRLVAEPALALPIRVRGEIIGVLDACKPDAAGEWTAEEIQLLETLSDQLGLALDSARLYQDTQRRAAQEQLVGEVTARMRETLEMDTVLRTAVREIGEALGIPEVEVRLARGGVSESLFSSASGNGHGKEEGAAA